jgi:hypothetical protein
MLLAVNRPADALKEIETTLKKNQTGSARPTRSQSGVARQQRDRACAAGNSWISAKLDKPAGRNWKKRGSRGPT